MFQFSKEETALEAAKCLAVRDAAPILVMARWPRDVFNIGPRHNAALLAGHVDYMGLSEDSVIRCFHEQEGAMRVKLIWALLTVILWFTTPSLAATQVQDTSRHLYERVMEEYKHGDFEAALAGFRLFLELHRQSPLAANAQYWIGECQYRLGRYQDALNSFYNVGAYNAVSPKLAASAFKIGQTYLKLGDYAKARLTFDRVIDQYSDGVEAELARKAMASIDLSRHDPSQLRVTVPRSKHTIKG
jgi:tol-pal system protein YbgF